LRNGDTLHTVWSHLRRPTHLRTLLADRALDEGNGVDVSLQNTVGGVARRGGSRNVVGVGLVRFGVRQVGSGVVALPILKCGHTDGKVGDTGVDVADRRYQRVVL
jgi:hypothetical protein